MTLKYTFDPDLDTVLQAASNEELEPLVEFIKSPQGSPNLAQSADFKRFYPDHTRYTHVLSHEIRALGGHSVANLLRRGQGPSYRTIVCDVAKKMKVNFDEDSDAIAVIEHKLLAHILRNLYQNMNEEQKALFVSEVKQYQANDSHAVVAAVEKADLQTLNPKAMVLLSSFVANTIEHIMGFTSALSTMVGTTLNQSLQRLLKLIVQPLSWLSHLLSSLTELGGPSYKATVPCVLHIAMLRVKQVSGRLPEHIPDPNFSLAKQAPDKSPLPPVEPGCAPNVAPAPAPSVEPSTTPSAEAKHASSTAPATVSSTVPSSAPSTDNSTGNNADHSTDNSADAAAAPNNTGGNTPDMAQEDNLTSTAATNQTNAAANKPENTPTTPAQTTSESAAEEAVR